MTLRFHSYVAVAASIACTLAAAPVLAQEQATVKGTVAAVETGQPISGAVVLIGGSAALADDDGVFSANMPPGTYSVKVLSDGYQEWVHEVTLQPGSTVELPVRLISGEVIVIVDIGARTQRSHLATPVPVDVISEEAISGSGHGQLDQALTSIAPSFNAQKQTISDGTDHINPASLRGLGPDQVLVLVNGKRRHTSALVNVNGTFGRGTVGTNLNAIPASAIKRIEVLRDGASAQYGSDAIAGVVNIVLKDSTDVVEATARSGITASGDGEEFQTGVNWGHKLGKGFVNVTGEFLTRGKTNRARPWSGQIFPGITDPDETDRMLEEIGRTREDYTMEVGQSGALVGMLFLNARLPITDAISAYATGGLSGHKGYASGFYRLPFQIDRVDPARYPDGFLPEINPEIWDWSLSGGLRGTSAGWRWDLSATHGGNSFRYFIDNSINASLENSPTSFDAGGLRFGQTTINADVIRPVSLGLVKSLSLVLGAEARFENYQINAGQEESYVLGTVTYTDAQGRQLPKAPGAQVFPGFQPDNEVDAWRSSQGVYAGIESQVTKDLLIDVAGRFENYSDFGNSVNGKIAARLGFLDDFALRGAVSTGFRAPSLPQMYFNAISTLFVDVNGTLEPRQVLTARNDSEVTRAFGIPQLDEETSVNVSAGITARPSPKLSITADAYYIDIRDRIVLTGLFAGDPNGAPESIGYQVAQILDGFPDVSRAQFFANSVDTSTVGVDFVLAYNTRAGAGDLELTASATFTRTMVEDVHIPQGVADQFSAGSLDAVRAIIFNREEENRLEGVLPRQKGALSARYTLGRLTMRGRVGYYGPVVAQINDPALDEYFSSKTLFDADLGYQLGSWRLGLGAINLFNTFPDEQKLAGNISDGRFPYSRRTSQMSINGGFYYLRLQYVR